MGNVVMLQAPTPEEAMLYRRKTAYDELMRCLEHRADLGNVAWLVKEAIATQAWLERPTALGRTIVSGSLYRFVHEAPPEGLRTDYATIESLIRADPAALALWTEATRGKQGETQERVATGQFGPIDNNVHDRPESPKGNSREAALRRLNKLEREGDERAAEERRAVIAGEKSPHRALVDLGLRRETFTVAMDVRRVAEALKRKFTPSQCAQIAALLVEDE